MQPPGRRPLRKAIITSAIHPDLPVTPGLLANPVNHRISISPIEFIGNGRIRTAPLAASVSDDPRETVRRRASSLREIVVIACIDGEREQRRLTRLGGFGPEHLRCDMRSIRRCDENIPINDVTFRVIFRAEYLG